MRRGFKTDARAIAEEVRGELGLGLLDALDPFVLASHLAIPVWALSSYAEMIPRATVCLGVADSGAVSAMLAFTGLKRVIVFNDCHALTRQHADIAHELAHALLLHTPHVAAGDGQPPEYDSDQEEEAKWLGAALLVTDEYCVSCARDGVQLADAAARMTVSPQLMRWRFNMSGARRRVPS
jgi:hypothetical protein